MNATKPTLNATFEEIMEKIKIIEDNLTETSGVCQQILETRKIFWQKYQENEELYQAITKEYEQELKQPIDSDLDGFEDTRVRTVAYYTAMWYSDSKTDNIDRCHLYNLYRWLIEEKPTLEVIFQDYRHHLLIYYLDNFDAENGDFMGSADLQDIKLELKYQEHEADDARRYEAKLQEYDRRLAEYEQENDREFTTYGRNIDEHFTKLAIDSLSEYYDRTSFVGQLNAELYELCRKTWNTFLRMIGF